MSGPALRDVRRVDLPAVHALNEAAVPHVNSLPLARFEHLIANAAYFRVAELGPRFAGFLVGLTPGTDYRSPNFLWFVERYARFVYIDRVVTAEEARRRGVAAALYRDLERFAAALAPRLTCEVNTRPANPGSLRFHEALGFRIVGEQETDGGAKRVVLMEKSIVAGDGGAFAST